MKEGRRPSLHHHRRHPGPPPETARQLEVFRRGGHRGVARDHQVDEWALNHFARFRRHAAAIGRQRAVEFGASCRTRPRKKAAEGGRAEASSRCSLLKDALKATKAEDVRVASRLVSSPACLVVQDDGMSTQLNAHAQAGRPERADPPVLKSTQTSTDQSLTRRRAFHDLATSFSTRPCWPKGFAGRSAAYVVGECLAVDQAPQCLGCARISGFWQVLEYWQPDASPAVDGVAFLG